jgi:hypothetical protein
MKISKGAKFGLVIGGILLALGVIPFIYAGPIIIFWDDWNRGGLVRAYNLDGHRYCVEALDPGNILSMEVWLREGDTGDCGEKLAGLASTQGIPVSEFDQYFGLITLPDADRVNFVLVLQAPLPDRSCKTFSEGPCDDFPYELQKCIHPESASPDVYPAKKTCINEHVEVENR